MGGNIMLKLVCPMDDDDDIDSLNDMGLTIICFSICRLWLICFEMGSAMEFGKGRKLMKLKAELA